MKLVCQECGVKKMTARDRGAYLPSALTVKKKGRGSIFCVDQKALPVCFLEVLKKVLLKYFKN
jgi:hypothetical protein